MNATVAGGPVTVATHEAAMGLDLDLQDGGILGAADRGEGTAAVAAAAQIPWDLAVLKDDGQVRVVAAAWSRLAVLLAALPPGYRAGTCRSRGRQEGGSGLGLAAEELLLAE